MGGSEKEIGDWKSSREDPAQKSIRTLHFLPPEALLSLLFRNSFAPPCGGKVGPASRRSLPAKMVGLTQLDPP